ncbi:IS66 family transposase [Bradyrhizobium sp. HKCCYLRH2015]|uniref:IS66 family transposase n=1 Tax=unclassified Bradyrhizobium TaxID=2631580 RepID=UPI003EC0C6EF
MEVGCWAHARRKFFEIAQLKARADHNRSDREDRCVVRGRARDQHPAGPPAQGLRNERSCSLVEELEASLHERRAETSGKT